jgi:outer membrane cobalamin receptor
MKIVTRIHVLLVSIFACCALTYAQPPAEKKKPTVELFETVIVTAELAKPESATTIAEVTAAQIQSRNVNNIGEAFELLPGVQFRQARSKNEQQVTVRGFEQEKVLILMDGIPVSIPYEGQLNLADIPVQNIASIKLIKGVSSTLYGANGMGGVINVITKQGTEKPSVSAQYEGSQYATHNIQLGHGWKKGPFSYYAAFSHRESNGYPLAETFTLPQSVLNSMASAPSNPSTNPNVPLAADEHSRDNADYERNAFTFTGTLALGSKNTLGVSFERYDNEYGAPPVPIYRENRSRRLFYFPRYWRFTDWNRTMVKVRGFYDMYDNVLDIYDGPTYTTQNRISPPSGNTLYDDYDAGFNIYGYWKGIPGNELRAALNFRRDVHRSTSATPPPAGPTDILSSDTTSIGVEDEIRLGSKFSVTPGFSFDFLDKRQRLQASVDQTPGEDISSFSPQIGFRYAPSNKLSFYGSIGRKIRFPTMRNLYADGVVGPLGNPDLKEESTINYEAGASVVVSPKVELGGAFFYSHIENMINFDNMIGRFEQYPRAYISGLELTATGNITEATRVLLSYTYMHSRVLDPVTINNSYVPTLVYSPEELPYRPAHQFDLEINHRFNFGLDANFNGMYVSEATYYNHADPASNLAMIASKVKLTDYFLANAKLTQKVKGGFSIYFAMENMLNKQYETLYLYPAAGRTYRGGLRFEM